MFSAEHVYLTAVINGVLQTVAFLSISRGDRYVNRMMALLIGLLTFSLWTYYTYIADLPAYWRLVNYEGWYTVLFWGPTIYFYVGMLSGQMQFNWRAFLRHSSPGIVVLVVGMTFQLMKANGWLTQAAFDNFGFLTLLAGYIQISLYLLLSFQLLKAYDRKIRDNFTSIDGVNLTWLQRLLAIFAVIMAVDLAVTVPAVLSHSPEIPYFDMYFLAEAISIFTIGYFTLLHAETLFRNIKPKYENSPLNDQVSLELATKLKSIMQEAEPYKENDLKLDGLAQLVDVTPHYLSQVINEQFKTSFYDFINEYRVKSATERLLADNTTNITQIAYDVGFNNRASFNNAFKKRVGTTPSQYRRLHNDPRAALKENA